MDTAELQRQLEEYQAIFAAMPIMLWFKDKHNKHIRLSKAAADLEGTTPDKIEGKTAEELYPAEQAAAFYKDDLEVINSGNAKLGIIEKHVTAETGAVRWLQTGKVPLRDKNGDIMGVVAIAIDITPQMEAQAALQKAHDDLKAAHAEMEEKHRSLTRLQEFLRSTLDYIAEALQRGARESDIRRYVANARTEADKMR